METTIYNIDDITENKSILVACGIAKQVIEEFYFVKQREEEAICLLEQEKINAEIGTYPMGSGGVGKVKIMKDGSARIQIGYGTGRYNYALCIVINNNK